MTTRKPVGATPKPVAQAQVLTLSTGSRFLSGVVAVAAAIALYNFVTHTSGTQSVLVPSCKQVAKDCVAEISRTPDAGVTLALLGVALIFALFATTGIIWTITTSLFTSAPFIVTNTSAGDAEKAAPSVKKKLTPANVEQIMRFSSLKVPDLQGVELPELKATPEELASLVPADVWVEAEQRWEGDYGATLLPALDDVRHSPGSDTYYLIAKVPGGNSKRAIKVVRQN